MEMGPITSLLTSHSFRGPPPKKNNYKERFLSSACVSGPQLSCSQACFETSLPYFINEETEAPRS